tara:strand:- start:63247 stop:63813 length:567 start_codon:yes stop_codon:yes gene_type:complete
MKKVLFIATMLISGLSFAQTQQSTKKSLETTVSELISDTADGLKSAGQTTKELFMDAIDIIIEEGTIIVTQYIIFTSLQLFLPMLIGLVLFFIIRCKILPLLTMNLSKYNKLLNKYKETKNSYNRSDKPVVKDYKYFIGMPLCIVYFTLKYINVMILVLIIATHILPWIKITFMPKLYLFELITEKLL